MLNKTQVALLGVSPEANYSDRVDRSELMRQWSIALENLHPRADKDAVIKRMMANLRKTEVQALGCDQAPIMLRFGTTVYAAVIVDLLSTEDRDAFLSIWKLRGIQPVRIEARKEHGKWQYYLAPDSRQFGLDQSQDSDVAQ